MTNCLTILSFATTAILAFDVGVIYENRRSLVGRSAIPKTAHPSNHRSEKDTVLRKHSLERVANERTSSNEKSVQFALNNVDGECSPPLFAALTLLWRAESSYGKQMVGDGGMAKGHFQQHEGHWQAGCRALGVDWVYACDSQGLAKSAAITAANWSIYAKQALVDGDVEMLVRSHRLPNNPMRADNDLYVERVMR